MDTSSFEELKRIKHASQKPVVMCFSGHDSSGGAGIQADIETLNSLGCHCCPIVTLVSAQDTNDIKNIHYIEPSMIIEQAQTVLQDMNVKVIKIGLIASLENIQAIHQVLLQHKSIPVVLDPILSTGGGTSLSDKTLIAALRELILPYCTIITPNTLEANILSTDKQKSDLVAKELMSAGAEYVMVTGGHQTGEELENKLWGKHEHLKDFNWPRLEGEFHGSGCTLASAIAGLLAHGLDIVKAIEQAQLFTWQSLKQADRLGQGQLIPKRNFL